MYHSVKDIDNGRGYACVEICVPYAQFCYEPETAVKKNKVY